MTTEVQEEGTATQQLPEGEVVDYSISQLEELRAQGRVNFAAVLPVGEIPFGMEIFIDEASQQTAIENLIADGGIPGVQPRFTEVVPSEFALTPFAVDMVVIRMLKRVTGLIQARENDALAVRFLDCYVNVVWHEGMDRKVQLYLRPLTSDVQSSAKRAVELARARREMIILELPTLCIKVLPGDRAADIAAACTSTPVAPVLPEWIRQMQAALMDAHAKLQRVAEGKGFEDVHLTDWARGVEVPSGDRIVTIVPKPRPETRRSESDYED